MKINQKVLDLKKTRDESIAKDASSGMTLPQLSDKYFMGENHIRVVCTRAGFKFPRKGRKDKREKTKVASKTIMKELVEIKSILKEIQNSIALKNN